MKIIIAFFVRRSSFFKLLMKRNKLNRTKCYICALTHTIQIAVQNNLFIICFMVRLGKELSNITKNAVLKSIEEYETIGQENFLSKYGYKKQTKYTLIYEDKHYTPKAIFGVAWSYQFPKDEPLKSSDLSSGEKYPHAIYWLRKLGFEVRKS
tara:strand:- start:328 stop:783 length:456 start_codon:yes stop_codon:yes gene_type:complete